MKKKTKTINQSVEKVVSELLSQNNPSEIFGKDGILQELKKPQFIDGGSAQNSHLSSSYLHFIFSKSWS